MMPQVVSVRVQSGRHRTLRLWIPTLPVLVLLSPLVLTALVIACLATRVNPGRAIVVGWRLLSSLGNTRIEMEQGETAVLVNLK